MISGRSTTLLAFERFSLCVYWRKRRGDVVPEDLSPQFHRPARSCDQPGEAAAVRRIMPTKGATLGPPRSRR
jgi:hypothetical protein